MSGTDDNEALKHNTTNCNKTEMNDDGIVAIFNRAKLSFEMSEYL